MNKIGIGLVGCGTVGSGLIRNLPKANGLIAQRLGIQLEISAIAIKD
jgi:homoserine dehydrogenase